MRNVTSTYQESVSGGGRGSPSAPTFGRVRITQTSSERRTESVPDGAAWAHQASFTSSPAPASRPSPAPGPRINKETYYDRRYSVSTTGGGISGGGGGYISGDQLNGDVSKSYHRRSPLTHTKQDYHRRYSVSNDGNYQRDYTYNGMGDLDFEAEEYLSREPRPYKGSVRKVVRQTSNHFSSGGDAPYISPYSKGSLGISQGDFGGRTSPKIFVHRRAPGLRAGSLSRIETLESLRENRGSYPRAMSLSRGSGVRRVASDLVDVEFGSQPLDLGHEDDSYEIRRQLRIARNRARASSASRLDPRVRAGSVPSGDVRIIYPPRYPVTSITGGSPVYNNSTAEIHIVQSMGSRSPRRRRAASVSRVSYTGGVPRVVESPLAGVTSSRRQYRSSSISSRVAGSTYQSPYIATGYTASSPSPSPSYVPSSPGYSRMTSSTSETHTRVRDPTLYGVGPENDEDLTRYVLEPGEKFLPTDVSVSMLPSGQKAVTYTRFRQTGSGDHRQANIEIERIIEKTKKLQDSLNTLEDFVRRNRSLFPEDIIIYQKIIFYLLGEDELRAHGYPPDAEVYGVKIREKLVAPYGSDVASILKRYYKRYTEVDVIYEEREAIKRRLREAELESKEEQEEEERRRKRRIRVDTEIIEEEEEWLRRRREAAKKRKYLDETLYVDEEELIPRLRHSPRRPRDFDDGAEPPQFSAKPKPRTVCTGDTVKFSCAVFGHPEPTIEWFHNNKPLFNTSRHTIDDRYIGSSSLCIRNIQKEDAGSYTARAVNMHGEVSATAALYIEEDELTRRKEALRRPWFIHEVHNTTTQVGQMVVLEAQATGKPLPTFRWQRNNMDILDDVDHIRVVSDGAGGTKLIIRDVRPGDAGLYVCVAENTAGRTACSATLRVGESFDLTEYYTLPKFGEMPDFPHTHPHTPSVPHSAPYPVPQAGPIPKSRLPQLPFELDDIIMKNWNNPAGFYLDFDGEEPAEGRKPRFVKVPSTHITVQEGDPLTLRCTVDGQPKPIVKWYKGVRELTYTGRHRVLAEGNDTHMMQIRMTMLTDPGEYTIVALNRCGMVKYTVFVNVVPKSPEEVEATRKRPEHALQEYDLIKKTAQGKMAPVFIKRLPREKQILVGGTLKLECHVGEAKMKEYVVGYEVVAKDSGAEKQRPVTSSSSNVLPQNGYPQSSEPAPVQSSTQQVPNVPVTQVQVQPEPVIPTHIPEVPATSTAEIPVQIVQNTEQVPTSTTQEPEVNISQEKQIPDVASEEGKEKKSKKKSKKSDKSASPEAPSKVPTVIESTPAETPADPAASPAVAEVSFESSDEETMQAEIKNVEHSEPIKAESVEQAAVAETVSPETPAEVVPIAITPESVEPEAKETAGTPVRLQTMLESCVAPLGSNASFTCSVSGTPPIKVEWLKSDQPLFSTDNITIDTNISSDGNGSCRLSISRLSTQDEGSYTIKVSNDFGLGSSTASLSVIDKVVPQISVTFDDDENEDDDEELSELSAAEND